VSNTISIRSNDRVFVLTGAGISAESGIPTFRDSDGLWNGYRVEEVATPEAWEDNPERVWKFYSMRRRDAQRCKPNSAHEALAALESQLGERFFLCTQNVDDLHERAGSRNLVHMHGELFSSRCESNCGAAPYVDKDIYETADQIPICACGARIRPDIVWFGEYPLAMDRIMRETGAEMLAVSVMPGPQMAAAVPLCRDFRQKYPQVPVVWGGYFPSLYADATLNAPYVDFAVRGQGEDTFLELLAALRGARKFGAIRGLSYKDDFGLRVHNIERPMRSPER